MAGNLVRLKKRSDFLRVAAARSRAATPGLLVQAAPQPAEAIATPAIRVGFTASRKVGIAVVRNRAKRRLRALADDVLARHGRPGTDYVLIARAETARRSFALLTADLEAALRRVHRDGAPQSKPMGPEQGKPIEVPGEEEVAR